MDVYNKVQMLTLLANIIIIEIVQTSEILTVIVDYFFLRAIITKRILKEEYILQDKT